jgi:ribosome maturation factor RimP
MVKKRYADGVVQIAFCSRRCESIGGRWAANAWADSSSPFFLPNRFLPIQIWFLCWPGVSPVAFAGRIQPLMNWQSAVERTVTGLGYELVDTERSAGGLLRVYIDKLVDQPGADSTGSDPAQNFITVDDCEKVTRQLQHVLEVEGCAYERLEVSSPGLDRPLKKPADFERFAGEQVALTLKMPFQGRKKYQGELQAAEPGWRIVFIDGKTQTALGFSLDEVKEARLVPVLDFKGRRFSKPGPGNEVQGGLQDEAPNTAQPLEKGSKIEVDGGRIQ